MNVVFTLPNKKVNLDVGDPAREKNGARLCLGPRNTGAVGIIIPVYRMFTVPLCQGPSQSSFTVLPLTLTERCSEVDNDRARAHSTPPPCVTVSELLATTELQYWTDAQGPVSREVLRNFLQMGKRAFSAKAKREQLRVKRASALESSASSGASGPTVSGGATVQAGGSSSAPSSSTPQKQQQHHSQVRRNNRSGRRSNAERYKLKLSSDSDASRAAARAQAFIPVVLQGRDCDEKRGKVEEVASSVDGEPLSSLGVHDIRPRELTELAGPKRPLWSYEESLAVLEKREERSFQEWVSKVQGLDGQVAYFEQNLETWRQLWRVVERSDVLILVADIRFPGLHFVPAFYDYVTRDLGKGMVLALNKCDLVSAELIDAWKEYFAKEYPGLALSLFSCFPDSKLAPAEEANSELLSKREKRMARSKLAAWGADQLLAAVDELDLPPVKKEYLGQWRAKLVPSPGHATFGDNSVDEDDMEEANRLAECEVLERMEKASKVDRERDQVSDAMATIGVIGHPNSGKSSMINGVFGRKVVSTSRTPGHTKHLQTMFLSPQVRLCDCPGLVFPGRASREIQVLAGMYPIAQLREPYAVIKYLADRVPVVDILDLQIECRALTKENEEPFPGPQGWTAWAICEAWAFKRGFRTAKAARLDVFRAANNILRLSLDGRIVLATTPPGFVASEVSLDSVDRPGPVTVLDSGVAGREEEEDSDSDEGSSGEDSDDGEDGGIKTSMGMFALLDS